MVTRTLIGISLGDLSLPTSVDNEPIKMFFGSTKRFRFELYRKQTRMGDLEFSQFWMSRPSVYGKGDCAAPNRIPILEFAYWYLMQDLLFVEKGFLESIIFANLFQHSRIHGSRRVFADSVLTQPARLGMRKRDLLAELDKELTKNRQHRMDIVEFSSATQNLLGPHEYSDEVWERYDEFAERLLDDGRQIFTKSGIEGLREPVACWQDWMTGIARRGGHHIEKQVLDILSQEASAALNRCYTITWSAIVRRLVKLHELSDEAIRFHEFWHMERCAESNIPGKLFRLFQGHVFALHPGSGMFLSTVTGAEIMGDWLKAPEDVCAYQQLLHGLYIAMAYYARQSNLARTLRTKDSHFRTNYDMETIKDPHSSDDSSSAECIMDDS